MHSFLSFLQRQVKEIAKGGLPVLLSKLGDFLLMPLAILSIFIVRLLRPLIVVRLGPLYSSRIGHFAINTELYLCERDKQKHSQRTFDIFYHRRSISNYQLKRMWERTLHLAPCAHLAYLADRFNHWLPGASRYVVPMPMKNCKDIDGLLEGSSPHLAFTAEEEQRGRRELRQMDIPEGAEFVCVHARDSAYLETVFPELDWHYHCYRDTSLGNYIPAFEELARRGYFALRMGAIVKEPLNTDNSMIIDYASRYRKDFLDIFLSAKCRFFIASGSGIDEVPKIFRRPVMYVNFVPLENIPTTSPVHLFIPKKIWLRKQRRFLTFGEMLRQGWKGAKRQAQRYRELGVDIVENTAEEISATVQEMDERLKGTWPTSCKDEELQERFRSLFRTSKPQGRIVARIGAQFLRQNQELLK